MGYNFTSLGYLCPIQMGPRNISIVLTLNTDIARYFAEHMGNLLGFDKLTKSLLHVMAGFFTNCNNPLTRQGDSYRSERRGDGQRVVDNPLTCQGALCNRSKRRGDGQRVVDNSLLARDLYVIEEKGKEIANVLSTQTSFTGPPQRWKIVNKLKLNQMLIKCLSNAYQIVKIESKALLMNEK